MIGGEYFRWGAVVIVGTNKNEGATLPFFVAATFGNAAKAVCQTTTF